MYYSVTAKFVVDAVLLWHFMKNLTNEVLFEDYLTTSCELHWFAVDYYAWTEVVCYVNAKDSAVFPDIDTLHYVVIEEDYLKEGV